jgi:hypothetical protein
VTESKLMEQEQDNEDRQARFWMRRPGRVRSQSSEREHIIYILESKRVSDTVRATVCETQKLAEIQHFAVSYAKLQKKFMSCALTSFEVWLQQRGQGQGYQKSRTDPVG